MFLQVIQLIKVSVSLFGIVILDTLLCSFKGYWTKQNESYNDTNTGSGRSEEENVKDTYSCVFLSGFGANASNNKVNTANANVVANKVIAVSP